MDKKKILFITPKHHKKTKSFDALANYLNEFFEVTRLYDDARKETTRIDYNECNNNYEAVVFCQILPDIELLAKIKLKNLIFVPMYDFSMNWSFLNWSNYKNFKILNFSKTLHSRLTKWGFDSLYIQYFIEPGDFIPGSTNEVFFWQRVTDVHFNTIERVLPYKDFKIHIHKDLDPHQKFLQPAKIDEENYQITYSTWFEKKQDLIELIQKKGIYIAPRLQEGIGMSFLEAMAMGKVIIAHNEPTMNEYITHGITGFLVDFRNPGKIDISNLQTIQENTYKYSKNGYQNWLEDRRKIIDFVNKPVNECSISIFTKISEVLIKIPIDAVINIFHTKISDAKKIFQRLKKLF